MLVISFFLPSTQDPSGWAVVNATWGGRAGDTELPGSQGLQGQRTLSALICEQSGGGSGKLPQEGEIEKEEAEPAGSQRP